MGNAVTLEDGGDAAIPLEIGQGAGNGLGQRHFFGLDGHAERPAIDLQLGEFGRLKHQARRALQTGFKLGTGQVRSVSTLRWKKQVITDAGIVFTPFSKIRTEVTSAENVPGSTDAKTSQANVLPSAGLDLRYPMVANGKHGSSVVTPVAQIIAGPDAPKNDEYGNENAITLNFDHTNLFLDDRSSGTDRYEGGTRANAGITYNYIANNGWSVRAAVGESFHLAGKNSYLPGSGLDGPKSDLIGAVAVQPWDHLDLTYAVRAEEDLSRINAQEASASLTFDRISASVAYADITAAPDYGRPDREQQIWGDARLKLSEAWSLFGSFRYDIEDNHFMEKTIGIAFTCDCMNAQLAYSQSRNDSGETEHKIELGVELRTIGGVNGGFSL